MIALVCARVHQVGLLGGTIKMPLAMVIFKSVKIQGTLTGSLSEVRACACAERVLAPCSLKNTASCLTVGVACIQAFRPNPELWRVDVAVEPMSGAVLRFIVAG